MRTWLALIVLSSFACKKDSPPSPSPSPPPSPSPSPSPSPPPPAACTPTILHVEKDGITVHRDKDTTVKPPELEATLKDLARACIGPLGVMPGDDVRYQDVITAMDIAIKVGFTDVAMGDAATSKPKPVQHDDWDIKVTTGADGKISMTGTRKPPAPDALAKVPVVIVTTSEITLAGKHLKLDAADLAKQVTDILKAAPKVEPAGTAIVQADASTTGKVISEVVRGASDAGYDNVLFAVKSH